MVSARTLLSANAAPTMRRQVRVRRGQRVTIRPAQVEMPVRRPLRCRGGASGRRTCRHARPQPHAAESDQQPAAEHSPVRSNITGSDQPSTQQPAGADGQQQRMPAREPDGHRQRARRAARPPSRPCRATDNAADPDRRLWCGDPAVDVVVWRRLRPGDVSRRRRPPRSGCRPLHGADVDRAGRLLDRYRLISSIDSRSPRAQQEGRRNLVDSRKHCFLCGHRSLSR